MNRRYESQIPADTCPSDAVQPGRSGGDDPAERRLDRRRNGLLPGRFRTGLCNITGVIGTHRPLGVAVRPRCRSLDRFHPAAVARSRFASPQRVNASRRLRYLPRFAGLHGPQRRRKRLSIGGQCIASLAASRPHCLAAESAAKGVAANPRHRKPSLRASLREALAESSKRY